MGLSIALAVAALALLVAHPATAYSRSGFSMDILVDGVPLSEYAARGTTYVEAHRGREYAIRLRNNTNRRVAIALAVDGLNSIDAKTTRARTASKWVLDPYETITINGWQTDSKHARRFFFTTEDESYGAWLGRTENLGVIEAVVFREKRPHWITRLWTKDNEGGRKGRHAPAPAPSSAQPRREGETRSRAEDAKGAGELSDEFAATGIGRKVDHRVRRVKLELESRPAARLRIRYEYRPQLVRLGVLPQPWDDLDRREHSQGFDDMPFCPDPYDP
jgi:hypothetical protein